ncbi:Tkl protein kinase, partial [Globisporangium splendens]
MAPLRSTLLLLLLLLLLTKDAAEVSAATRVYSRLACPSVATLYSNCTDGSNTQTCVAYPLTSKRMTGSTPLQDAAGNCYNVVLMEYGSYDDAEIEQVAGLPITTESSVYVLLEEQLDPELAYRRFKRRGVLEADDIQSDYFDRRWLLHWQAHDTRREKHQHYKPEQHQHPVLDERFVTLWKLDFSASSELETLYFEDNQIVSIEGVKFPPNLKELNLIGSEISRFTIRALDVAVLKSLTLFNVTAIDVTQCDAPAVKTPVAIAGSDVFDLCVLQDADFDRIYAYNTGDSSDKDSLWTLPVVILSVVAAIIVTIVLGMVIYRKRKMRQLHATRTSTRNTTGTSTLDAASKVTLLDDIRNDPVLSAFRVDQKEVNRVRTIAKGGFGVVHLATMGKRDIIIKQLLPEKAKDPRAITQFVAEIRLCSKLDHPKIVSFLGLTWSTLADLAILMEYMPNGDLAHLLKKQHSAKNSLQHFNWTSTNATLGRNKLQLAQDVAEALVYLHSSSIVHRDLKAQNVLLSSVWEAKLTDFGVSRELGDEMTAEIGTVAWIAPEILKGDDYGVQADIYSFGVLMSELDTCQKPYASGISESLPNGAKAMSEPSNTRIALAVIEKRLQPKFHEDCPGHILNLAKVHSPIRINQRSRSVSVMRRRHCASSSALSPAPMARRLLIALLLLSAACDAFRVQLRTHERHSPTTSNSDAHSSSADEDATATPTAMTSDSREFLYNASIPAACPAVRTLVYGCHFSSDDEDNWHACVAGGAANETASLAKSGINATKKKAAASKCATAFYAESWVPDSKGQVGVVDASGLRIAAVESVDPSWATLNLADNRITSFASIVPPTDYLANLNVSSNPLGTLTATDKHSSLETLFASNASLTAINVTAASNLQGLLVPHNSLSSFENIALPSSLNTLDLRENPISRFEIQRSDLAILDKLTSFRVAPFTSEGCATRNGFLETVGTEGDIRVCVLEDVTMTSVCAVFQIGGLYLALGIAVSILLVLFLARRFVHQKNTLNIELTRDLVLCDATWIEDDATVAAMRLETTDVNILKTIHKGKLAIVYLSRMRGRDNELVAVKKIRVDKAKDAYAFSGLLAEIRLHSTLEHPKVVQFVGYCWGKTMTELALVTEYLPNGNLNTLLKKQSKSADQLFSWYSSQLEGTTTPAAKVLIAMDVAEALVYLHSFEVPIVHGAIQAENVLLSGNWEAKVSGFGATKSVSELMNTGAAGCIAWTAPEILKHEPFDIMADIYAFGVFLAELDACANPYANARLSNAQIALAVSEGDLKPAFRDDCPCEIVEMVTACLSLNPAERPMAMKLHYDLRQLYRANTVNIDHI